MFLDNIGIVNTSTFYTCHVCSV